MKIVFFGTPQFAVASLESLLQHQDIEVVAVVTHPDKKRGRGNKIMPSAVKKVALEHNITVWQPKRIKKDQETLDKLQAIAADAFVVVAYGQILSPEILQMPKLGCINAHGSLLPKYRGAAPIQWSIYNGDIKTGVTTMLMDEGMDTGAMLLKAETPIGILDNAHQIAIELSSQSAALLVETLFKLQAATYARLINKSDYLINWSSKAIAIHNQVRGFFPNCVAQLQAKKLKIMATVPLTETSVAQLPEKFKILQEQWSDLATLTGKPGAIVKNLKNL